VSRASKKKVHYKHAGTLRMGICGRMVDILFVSSVKSQISCKDCLKALKRGVYKNQNRQKSR